MIDKIIKKICIICTIICTCFTLCINAKAETGSYLKINYDTCFMTFNGPYEKVYWEYSTQNSPDIRAVMFINNNQYSFIVVSDKRMYRREGSGSCPAGTYNETGTSWNGYFLNIRSGGEAYKPTDYNGPVYYEAGGYDRAIYYTFGEGSVDPIEPTNWGQLRNVNYSTKIAGTGEASLANVDTITWQTDIDTYGNEITESCTVDIRAVRGSWTGNTLEDLLKMTGDNLVTSNTVAPVLATLPANTGTFSIEWDEVIEELNIEGYINLLAKYFPNNEKYIKEGWIYEIRLVNELDNYEGTWQRIYTATSATAQGSETIINSNNFDIDINQMLQEISILNHQETTTININDVDYYTQNPETGVEPDGGTNLWDILKALLEGIFQLLAKLGDIAGAIVNLVSDLLNGLLEFVHDLIIPADGLPDITDELNDNINNYIEIEQPELHALQVKINDTASELRSLASGQAGNCVISWPAVTMNLGLFQAGTVTLIQAGSVDFADMFNDLLDGAGITYNTYTFCVNGVIYCMLLAYINRHIISFLRKA